MEFVRDVYGSGPDNEVIANLLYALTLYDRTRFAEIIQRGVAYLEGQQDLDGRWASRWCEGPYYGIYVCLRLLNTGWHSSPAIKSALSFLRKRQLLDGGWGVDGHKSDPLSTALALLGLDVAQERTTGPQHVHGMCRGGNTLQYFA